GVILKGREGEWDAKQAAGSVALHDTTWGGSEEVGTFGGRYWMSYIGGGVGGGGADPVAIGVARGGDSRVLEEGRQGGGGAVVGWRGELGVWFCLGAFWGRGWFDTFACSKDLVHWRKWEGEDLIKPSEKWDQTYAHKPWVVKHGGVCTTFIVGWGMRGG